MATRLLSTVPRLLSSSSLRPITGLRAFSHCDDVGRVLREHELAQEAVFIVKRERELEEQLRKERKRLDQIRFAIMQIKDSAQAQKTFEVEVKDDRLIYRVHYDPVLTRKNPI